MAVTNGGPGSQRSFMGLLTVALRRRRLLVGLPLGVALVAVALSFVLPKEFEAESQFTPEEKTELPGQVSDLAAQFGMAMGGGSGESVDFYAELLQSNELLREVVLTDYDVPVEEGQDTLRGNLVELYGIEGETAEDRVKAAVARLDEEDVRVNTNLSAELVVLNTAAPWPELAESINRRMLDLVNQFNLERRQSRATQEQAFLDERVARSEQELREAEDRLKNFMMSNRQYQESAETLFEYGRLQRRVDHLQQVHSSLAQGLEQARLDAIRNTPVVTVVDAPEGTSRQTAPMPMVNLLLGLVLGGGLALGIVLVGEMMASARRANPGEYTELRDITRDTLDELRVLRRLRGVRVGDRVATVSGGATGGAGREDDGA